MSDTELIEHLCEVQHNAYEDAARRHNWSTNLRSRTAWANVPDENKATMRDSMVAVLAALRDAR